MVKNLLSLILVLFLLFLAGCTGMDGDNLFMLKSASETGLHFQNNLDDDAKFNILNYLNYYNGAGVGIGDFNNDGLQDIYFTSNLESNKLYINEGGLQFKDITDRANVKGSSDWTTGVTVADVNADGWLDIYVCGVGDFQGKNSKNELFINNGTSSEAGQITFTESAEKFGLDITALSTQAAFFDYDNDGDLDMYLLNHAIHTKQSYAPRKTMLNRTSTASGDRLFRNELNKGKHQFVEVTSAANILRTPIGFGLGITASDINQDGWIDIYISNDFHENDYLYINQKDGTFSEELTKWTEHASKSSMGNDIADYNNDGLVDIITADMYPYEPQVLQKSMGEDHYDLRNTILKNGYAPQVSKNCLQLNRRQSFSEIACLAGVEATDWSWTPLFADFDNDGLKDLYITNGIVRRPNDLDYLKYTSQKAIQTAMNMKMEAISSRLIGMMPQNSKPNIAYRNTGTLAFTNVTQKWGLNIPSNSNGAAYADLDNDGDLDLITNDINDEAMLFENRSEKRGLNSGSYLQIRFTGSGLNTTGIGAKTIVNHSGETYYQEQMPTRGFLSSISHIAHFGLGNITQVDSLTIVWPGGAYQLLKDVSVNQLIEVKQDDASGNYYVEAKPKPQGKPVFSKADSLDFRHQENTYHDIHKEPLMPRLLSTEGPGLAVGDINGDGLEDFFVTNAHEKTAGMFVQQYDGTFITKNQDIFNEDRAFEGVDATFFDADNDGDLDLIVASAGNQYSQDDEPFLLLDRLYINDGEGNFTKAKDAIPLQYSNTCCIEPNDYDKDGDIDLFVGVRSIAGSYGASPTSYLLQNDGHGQFSNISIPAELSEAGMVTDAIWVDLDNNGWDDLVLVGEWMGISIYLNHEGDLTRSSEDLYQNTTGWWNTIHAGDFDNDGDMDLVAGNAGLNTKLKATPGEPVRLYLKDFDSNGSIDPIITHYMFGKEYPIATRDVLNKQLVFLREKFDNYSDFAGTTINDLFTPEQLQGATRKEVVEFRSLYLENRGQGEFTSTPLPMEVNFAPVMDMATRDLNNDGLKDIIVGGNFYGFTPPIGRQDALRGTVLVNKGENGFVPLDLNRSKLFAKGQIRNMDWIKLANGRSAFVIAKNDEAPILLGLQNEVILEVGKLGKAN